MTNNINISFVQLSLFSQTGTSVKDCKNGNHIAKLLTNLDRKEVAL